MRQNNETGIDFAQVDMALEGYYPQMERDLLALLSFPTYKQPAAEGAPFGEDIADSLEYILALSQSLGLSARNVDGYCGFADMEGGGEGQLGVLTHLDVVPANADDWTSPPYEPEIRDGKIFARGTLDDKGPMIASLYAAVVLADCGIPLTKTVRLIFGCDEESGMSCMEHYLSKYAPPDISFSPDAVFPVIMGEKGIFHYNISDEWQSDDESALLTLLEAKAGSAVNVVPAAAEAVLAISPNAALHVSVMPPGVSLSSYADGTIHARAEGVSAHASTPEDGDNALAKLLAFLSGIDFAPARAKAFIDKLAAAVCKDPGHGAGFGVADSDEFSLLTNVPSLLDINAEGGVLTCDMRFPISKKCSEYEDIIKAFAAERGLSYEKRISQEPLYLGPEHPMVQTLLEIYREMSGDKDAQPLVMGGGTYAKVMPNCTAFGPERPGDPKLAHQLDEAIETGHLLYLAKIYARAIYALAK